MLDYFDSPPIVANHQEIRLSVGFPEFPARWRVHNKYAGYLQSDPNGAPM